MRGTDNSDLQEHDISEIRRIDPCADRQKLARQKFQVLYPRSENHRTSGRSVITLPAAGMGDG